MTAIDYANERSLKELISGVGHDLGLLVRQEIQLAKAEVAEKVSNTAKGGAGIGIGAMIAYVGVLTIVAALVLALVALGLAAWAAAALIGVILLIAGNAVVQGGRKKLTAGPPVLSRTKDNAKATVTELKERLT